MKFLLIGKIKDVFMTLPMEVQLSLNEDAWAFIKKYRDSGICSMVYNISGKLTNVTLWEADSLEVIDQRMVEIKMSSFMDFDIYLLSDLDANMVMHIDKMKSMLGRCLLFYMPKAMIKHKCYTVWALPS